MRWVVVAVAALLVGLLGYGIAQQGTDTSIDDALNHGKTASPPEAAEPLPRLGASGTQPIASYKGKVVLVNFWASWCPPCTSEMPLLERTQRRIAARGGTVLGVNTRDAPEDAMAMVRRFHITFPSLRDGSGDFADKWGLTGYPESFLLDRQGRIVAANRGPLDQRWIDQHLPPVLAAS
jgi:cytochrome c biogenesis protein CcmG/thiol:disulfide interchange protein DsbE